MITMHHGRHRMCNVRCILTFTATSSLVRATKGGGYLVCEIKTRLEPHGTALTANANALWRWLMTNYWRLKRPAWLLRMSIDFRALLLCSMYIICLCLKNQPLFINLSRYTLEPFAFQDHIHYLCCWSRVCPVCTCCFLCTYDKLSVLVLLCKLLFF